MTVYCTLKNYLNDLKAAEARKPFFDRRLVPSLRQISSMSDVSYSAISRIANNKVKRLDYETAGKIIKAVKDCGFDMKIHHMIDFKEEGWG